MTDVAEATASLLEERPGLEDDVETLLDIDAEGPWTFDDVPVDSGTFGEIVSRGIVEEGAEGYRVVDREAVRRGLSGEGGDGGDETVDGDQSGPAFDLESVEWTNGGAVVGSLLLIVLARLTSWPAVYRGGGIVLSGNDPYAYRTAVETMLADGFDPSSLPMTGEPLFVTTLWLVSTLLGGTPTVAGHVLAWYPVVAAVLTAALVYRIALALTEDRRVALAAVVLLALTPSHAFRTSLGYADHHAFDYGWLAATLYALVSLPRDRPDLRAPRTWLASGGVGVAIAGQTLAWEGAPLLLVPVALYTLGATVRSVERAAPPYVMMAPLLVGLGVGALLTQLVHLSVGWQSATVAAVPVILAAGGIGVVSVVTAVGNWRPDARTALAASLGVGALGTIAVGLAAPDVLTALIEGTDQLLRADGIAETQSLLGGSFGWLLLFGFILLTALPFVAWAIRRGREDTWWLLCSSYVVVLLALAALQVRFAGELSVVVAIFAGMGLVWLASWIDVARPLFPLGSSAGRTLSVPEPRRAAVLVGVVLLVTSLSLVQVPIKTSQVTTDDDTYRTATWIGDHADSDASDARSAYVFSQWSNSRVYNYFLSGDASSYEFAFGNYETFLGSSNGTEWYQRLRAADRDGFVVTTDIGGATASTLQHRLHENRGSRRDGTPGVGHYKLVYATGSKKVFTVIPGATLTGTGPANTTVTVSTPVDVPGASGPYRRQTTTDADGQFTLTVAHDGEYDVTTGAETQTVTVDRSAVKSGSTVAVPE